MPPCAGRCPARPLNRPDRAAGDNDRDGEQEPHERTDDGEEYDAVDPACKGEHERGTATDGASKTQGRRRELPRAAPDLHSCDAAGTHTARASSSRCGGPRGDEPPTGTPDDETAFPRVDERDPFGADAEHALPAA